MSCRRLTDAEVADARKAHASGYSSRMLAAAYGVSRTAMLRALAGHTYKGTADGGRKQAHHAESV